MQGVLKIAPPYDEETLARIRHGLEELTGEAVELSVEEDASLIGGFTLYAGGRVYDTSMRGKLAAIRQELDAVGRKENA